MQMCFQNEELRGRCACVSVAASSVDDVHGISGFPWTSIVSCWMSYYLAPLTSSPEAIAERWEGLGRGRWAAIFCEIKCRGHGWVVPSSQKCARDCLSLSLLGINQKHQLPRLPTQHLL